MTPKIRIGSLADIPAAISRLQAGGGRHRVPILQATFNRQIAHIELCRDSPARMIKQFLAIAPDPTLILLGDDDNASTGPSGFKQLSRLFSWCDTVIIHAAAGYPEQYKEAVALTIIRRRVLMIETDTAHAFEWADQVHRSVPRPYLVGLLPASGVHPTPPTKNTLN